MFTRTILIFQMYSFLYATLGLVGASSVEVTTFTQLKNALSNANADKIIVKEHISNWGEALTMDSDVSLIGNCNGGLCKFESDGNEHPALYVNPDDSANVSNIEFKNFRVGWGGTVVIGGYIGHSQGGGHSGMITFEDCRFISNEAEWDGAAIGVHSGNAFFKGCSFISNESTRGYGAAVYVSLGTTSISNCVFQDNVAKEGKSIYAKVTVYDCGGNTIASGDIFPSRKWGYGVGWNVCDPSAPPIPSPSPPPPAGSSPTSLNLSAGGKVLLNQTELIVVVLVSLLTFISLVVCFIYRVVQRKRGYNWVRFQQGIDDPTDDPTTPLPVGIKLST